MSPFRRRIGISTKLMVATFALLVGALTTLAWSTYQNSARIVAEGQYASMSSLVQHSGSTLAEIQGGIESLLLSIAANTDLWEMSDTRIESTLQTYHNYQPLVGSTYLIRDEGGLVGVPRPYVRALGRLVAPVVKEQLTNGSGIIWTKPYLSRISHWTVTAATRVYLPNRESPGYVAMDIPILTLIRDGLPSLSFGDGSTLLVLTRDNEIVAADFNNPLLGYRLSTNQLNAGSNVLETIFAATAGEISQVSVQEEAFSLLVGDATENGWRPVLLFDNSALQEGRQRVLWTSLAFLAMVGAASLALFALVARTFARPLEDLTQQIARVQKGRLEGIEPPQRDDEISDLVGAFNGMMERIRNLLDDLWHSEEEKKETEIRWLQAQIKPHFLYNTLNAIGYSAAMGRTQDVFDMIQSLTRVVSYTFRQDKSQSAETSAPSEEVILADELAFLDHYIRLQLIRYGRSFHTTYAIDAGLGRCLLLRLSLQPIVENAILHGLSQSAEGGLLHIAAHATARHLVVQISDNGPGIPAERMSEIDHQTGEGPTRIGLRNTADRLALHYGDDASLKIASPDPSSANRTGTRVTIRVPLHFAPAPLVDGASDEDDLLLFRPPDTENNRPKQLLEVEERAI